MHILANEWENQNSKFQNHILSLCTLNLELHVLLNLCIPHASCSKADQELKLNQDANFKIINFFNTKSINISSQEIRENYITPVFKSQRKEKNSFSYRHIWFWNFSLTNFTINLTIGIYNQQQIDVHITNSMKKNVVKLHQKSSPLCKSANTIESKAFSLCETYISHLQGPQTRRQIYWNHHAEDVGKWNRMIGLDQDINWVIWLAL